jgi:hypothetical protein
MRVTLAYGSTESMHFATVLLRLGEREAGVTVLIAPEGAEPLLGVEALEAQGLDRRSDVARAQTDARPWRVGGRRPTQSLSYPSPHFAQGAWATPCRQKS